MDLFECQETLPEDVQAIISRYTDALESGGDNGYEVCREFLFEMEIRGYTFEYGLDAVPTDLRLI
ncbi:hypothetical protein [Marinobacter sp. P4B1]|uniref:hypothetical protein n=1 Tax=Marinobacter sp. P4B1 TaxID=1119533 RepID=UPI000A482CA5|nr:hypothetical protein [Marinobacter sp. P4B1]